MKKYDKSRLIDDAGFARYFQAASWEEYNRKFFDALAPRYDFLNTIISFGFHDRFKKSAIEKIPVPANARVLDLCTGSGDIAVALAQRYPGISVDAVDASEKMLELAWSKAYKAGVSRRIIFRQGDVMCLPYPDNHFDIVVISFGLRNLMDIPSAIKEFRRVTRCGGVFVNIDLGKPRGFFRMRLYNIYFRRLIPFLGKHIFHRGEFNSFQYLSASNDYFPSPEALIKICLDAGFEHPKIYDHMLGGVSQQIAWKI